LDVSKVGYFKITLCGLPNTMPDEIVLGKLQQYGVPDKTKRSERETIKNGKWRDFQNGNRIFYMKTILSSFGMPQGFRLKGRWIRVFHYGQLRGRERAEAENDLLGRTPEQVSEIEKVEKERARSIDEKRKLWYQQKVETQKTTDERFQWQNNGPADHDQNIQKYPQTNDLSRQKNTTYVMKGGKIVACPEPSESLKDSVRRDIDEVYI